MKITNNFNEHIKNEQMPACDVASLLVAFSYWLLEGRDPILRERLRKMAESLILYTRRRDLPSDMCIHFMRLLLSWVPLTDFQKVLSDQEFTIFNAANPDLWMIATLNKCLLTQDSNQHVAGTEANLDLLPPLPGFAGEKLEAAKIWTLYERRHISDQCPILS